MLTFDQGTEAIEAIKLQLPDSVRMKLNTSTFEKMSTLRFLQIDNVDLSGSFKNIFKELKWLRWRRMKNLPDDFKPEKLVISDLQYGQFTTLWHDVKVKYLKHLPAKCLMQILTEIQSYLHIPFDHHCKQRLENLTVLDLGNCKCLKETPNFSGVKSLEKLYLNDCTSLLKIHPSIGILLHLRILFLNNCEMIPSLPDSICDLESLEQLALHGCSNLENLPEQIGSLKCLKYLDVAYTPIKHLPESTKLLSSLAFLNLENCNITSLPHSICDLELLKALSIKYCLKLQKLPEHISRMRGLRMAVYGTDIENILLCSKLLHWENYCAPYSIQYMDVDLQGRLLLANPKNSEYTSHYYQSFHVRRALYIECIDHYLSTLKPKE